MGHFQSDIPKMIQKSYSNSATVAAAGGTEVATIQPDVGKMYKLVQVWFYYPNPAGSTAGTHDIEIYRTSSPTTEYNGILRCVATTGNYIKSSWGQLVADSQELPTDRTEQAALLFGRNEIWVTNTHTLKAAYTNDTDADQTGAKVLVFHFLEYLHREE